VQDSQPLSLPDQERPEIHGYLTLQLDGELAK
jgi:hypothetical protein